MTTVLVGGYAELALGQGLTTSADGAGPPGPALTDLAALLPSGTVSRPSYVVRSLDRRFVYAVSEVTDGAVVAIELSAGADPSAQGAGVPPTGRVVSEVSSGGADPCHLALSADGRLMAVANYGTGTIGLVQVAGGDLTLVDTVQLRGSGPHPRQDGPHAHQATWLTETEIVVCDLGSDTLVGLGLQPPAAGDPPRLTQQWQVQLPPGTGPRHLVAAADGDCLWVIGELDNSLHLLRRQTDGPADQQWSLEQSLPLVATDAAQTSGGPDTEALAAGIVRDPQGRHLYVTVRGADLLIHVTIGADGRLREAGRHPTEHWPRFLTWWPDPAGVVVAAERAGSLQCFPAGADGGLGPVAWTAHWPAPTCLVR